MGLWYKKNKIASIGVAVSRLVTYHGLAFNVLHDQKMSGEVMKVFPCGLSGDTYVDLESVLMSQGNADFNRNNLIADFHNKALKNLKEALYF